MRIATALAGGALLVLIAHITLAQENEGDGASGGETSERDQLRIAVQEICPVSGRALGEHGDPVKVAVGQQREEIFLCCEACARGRLNARHWATIHANIARAQGMCPVMRKPLPRTPRWTIVNGQIVYVCCPPCTEKIEEDPATFLERVDGYYSAALEIEESDR
jgi:hypothetical protein